MSEPIQQPPVDNTAELETLRRVNADLLLKSTTRKARIEELEANAAALKAKATESEARIKTLTIDGPVNDLCEQISIAPEALRSAIDSDYRIELRDGVLTMLNVSDGEPVMVDGKAVPFQADAIKTFLLQSKDEAKKKLYSAIIIGAKASGAQGTTHKTQAALKPKIPISNNFSFR